MHIRVCLVKIQRSTFAISKQLRYRHLHVAYIINKRRILSSFRFSIGPKWAQTNRALAIGPDYYADYASIECC